METTITIFWKQIRLYISIVYFLWWSGYWKFFGGHAGENQIGAVYATLPCFPPEFASKLLSIFVVDIFFSKDRKQVGNDKMFGPLLEELKSLRNEGIEITIENKTYRLFFLTSLILGDNLGN